jgi:AbrB family looped-hinge helix DNA binding protein
MEKTRLSSKGQVVIPKQVRAAHRWSAGQEFVVIDVEDGVLLRAKSPFPASRIDDVAASLKYAGEPKTLDEMEAAIARGASEHQHGSR